MADYSIEVGQGKGLMCIGVLPELGASHDMLPFTQARRCNTRIPACVVPATSEQGETYTNIVFYRDELPFENPEVHIVATAMGIAAELRSEGVECT